MDRNVINSLLVRSRSGLKLLQGEQINNDEDLEKMKKFTIGEVMQVDPITIDEAK